jgi:hypothetical protein
VVVTVGVPVVVEPVDVEPELQLTGLLSTWVQVWVNVDGVVLGVVVVCVWVGTLSQQPL